MDVAIFFTASDFTFLFNVARCPVKAETAPLNGSITALNDFIALIVCLVKYMIPIPAAIAMILPTPIVSEI